MREMRDILGGMFFHVGKESDEKRLYYIEDSNKFVVRYGKEIDQGGQCS